MNLSPAEAVPAKPPTQPADAQSAAGRSFASVHASSLKAREASSNAKLASASATETSNNASAAARKGETYGPVAGRPYEEILSGPRNGMFINRSGNVRDGEAFVLVNRGERQFHIYGSGADRQVVPIEAKSNADAKVPAGDVPESGRDVDADADAPTAVSGEGRTSRHEDVPGRAFDEIMSGPRNGMFINRSGNARDGEAFVLVERARHELHIYGTGENRLVVRVIPPDVRDDAEKAKPPAADKPAPAPSASIPVAGSGPSSGIVLG